MREIYIGLLGAAALAMGSAATASVNVSAVPGSNPYAGPTPTYDFDTSTPTYVGGAVVGPGSVGNSYAQPYGSTGHYYTAGPSTSTPGWLLLSLGNVSSVTFIWGSIDDYNTLAFTDALGNSLGSAFTFTGTQIAALIPALANGNRSSADTNPLVSFSFTGPDAGLVHGMRLSSTRNAFEIDDITLNALPEPATWAMMLLGFGALGIGLRRSRKTAVPQLA